MVKRPAICFLLCLFLVAGFVSARDDCKNTSCSDDPGGTGLSEAMIARYPEPAVKPLPIATDLLQDRWYQQVSGMVQIYDAPNGNIVGSLDAGFNFVTSLSSGEGWTQINAGQWVYSDSLINSGSIVSQFTGVLLPDSPLPYPLAWTLINLYPSAFPGGEPDGHNPLIWRYSRTNLYSATEVNGEIWYQIGVDQWVLQYHVAKYSPIERPDDIDTNKWISLDLYEQVLVAYEGTQPVFATLVATGLNTWPTPEGIYHIYFRRQREDMSGGQPGADFYYLEEVPWTMFFDEGRALHGAYWHDGFGYRRSHGCVNLSITDAHWLYKWVAEDMGAMSSIDQEYGPAVYIYSTGQYK